ncbi:MAG: pyridoxal phosphate-dependent aminotransferase [Imperialibacter sp.]|uniref:pyridoxal phosphate-dependent aminotransferase n=1 Tax=Imperialibacter sp. TaxID=2038411 RepID=UPI003A85241D
MNHSKSNRRNWIKQVSILGATSLFLTPAALGNELVPRPKDIDSEFIRLNRNENPYGPSKKAQQAILNHIGSTNRYPFDLANDLANAIAAKYGVDRQMIHLGAGSSELLQTLGFWIIKQALPLTYCTPTFEILPSFVQRLNGQVQSVPMLQQFKYDLDHLLSRCARIPGVVYLVNPNNPTGSKIEKNDLLTFCQEVTKHSYLILDEAYTEYVSDDSSLITQINHNPKLIVVRTFSKIYGLAGSRIGYLMGHASLIEKLKDLSVWDNHSLNGAGIMAAMESIDDHQFVKESRLKNNSVKESTIKALTDLDIIPFASATNFIFLPTPNNDDLRSILEYKKITIGQLKIKETNYARISIGTNDEMSKLIKCLTEVYY